MQDKKFTPANFAEHLALLIAKRGITQKRLAADLGVSEASIVKWLRGSVPLGNSLTKVAKYFGLHPDYLLNPGKYRDVIDEANATAEREGRTPAEKDAIFNRLVIGGAQELMNLREAEDDGVNWRHRALEAERKLEALKRSLVELVNQY